MRRFRCLRGQTRSLGLLLAAALIWYSAASAQDAAQPEASPADFPAMQQAMAQLSSGIAKRLVSAEETEISLGAIDGPGDSRRLRAALATELGRGALKVTPAAGWSVKLDYQIDASEGNGKVAVQLDAKLKQRGGRPAGSFVSYFDTTQENVTRLLGPEATVAEADSGAAPPANESAPAEEVSTLAEAAGELAVQVNKQLTVAGEDAITVGTFDGPGAGQGIAKALTDALQEEGVKVTPQAGWRISGDYRIETAGELATVLIELQLKQRGGRPAGRLLKYLVARADDVVTLMGATVALSDTDDKVPGEPLKVTRSKEVVEAALDPKFTQLPEAFVSAPGSPYKVRLMVETAPGKYAPVPVIDAGGLPFAQLNEAANYAIEVHNDTDLPAGVEISIDGINLFAFSEIPGYRTIGKLFLRPDKRTLIEGWHLRNGPGGSRKFRVVQWGDSAQALLGTLDEGTLGIVSVNFYSAWDQNGQPPADEPFAPKGMLGTGLGEPTGNAYQDVICQFGALRAAVSIRYTKPTPGADLPE